MKLAHQMPFGASPRAGGGVDFRLWAPGASEAELLHVLDDGTPPRAAPAAAQPGGWWHFHAADAGPGTLYQWRLDGKLTVPDPASRFNPQGPHGPSRVVDPHAFAWDDHWTGRPWQDVVLYELHLGAFTAEGSFSAAAARLPQLAELGVTAVELMPVADFPGRFGWGYDGVLPFAPHAAYGTPGEFKAFVQAAHRLGMMVFLDVVYNHFGPDGNYLGAYAPDFFSATHHSPWGAAINYDGPGSRDVREFFIHNALFWLEEYRLDGLRLDAVHAIIDCGTPDVLDELSSRVREATAGRHVHLVLENEKNQGHRLAATPTPGRYDAQWNDDFHHVLHVLLTGESRGYYTDYAREPMALLAQCLTAGYVYEESPRKPGGGRERLALAQPVPLPAMVHFANNHDQAGNRPFGERLDALAPADACDLALLLALLTPATPMLFFGDEVAAPSPFLYFADWDGDLRDAVTEGRKREFGHDEHGLGGGVPVDLPPPCEAATFEASRVPAGHAATERALRRQALVRDALAVRRAVIVPRQQLLRTGGHEAQRVGATGLRVRWNYTDGARLLMEVNAGADPVHAAAAESLTPDAGGTALPADPVFSYNRPGGDPTVWPAWSACWRFIEGGA